jgi:imidazolonepropionase-like amidohydrolase
MPYINRAFEPNPKSHGSFFFDWKTSDEIAWKANYKLWMQFVNDYKNAGGRVAAGSDAGFIYGLYGFSYIRELELLQEAGFHPLEVLQSATINGATLLGLDKEIGSIELGKKADLVIVNENPIANFKVLYGTGNEFYNFNSNKMDRTKGIEFTIKDGIVYDAKQLLKDVREMVSERKAYELEAANNK